MDRGRREANKVIQDLDEVDQKVVLAVRDYSPEIPEVQFQPRRTSVPPPLDPDYNGPKLRSHQRPTANSGEKVGESSKVIKNAKAAPPTTKSVAPVPHGVSTRSSLLRSPSSSQLSGETSVPRVYPVSAIVSKRKATDDEHAGASITTTQPKRRLFQGDPAADLAKAVGLQRTAASSAPPPKAPVFVRSANGLISSKTTAAASLDTSVVAPPKQMGIRSGGPPGRPTNPPDLVPPAKAASNMVRPIGVSAVRPSVPAAVDPGAGKGVADAVVASNVPTKSQPVSVPVVPGVPAKAPPVEKSPTNLAQRSQSGDRVPVKTPTQLPPKDAAIVRSTTSLNPTTSGADKDQLRFDLPSLRAALSRRATQNSEPKVDQTNSAENRSSSSPLVSSPTVNSTTNLIQPPRYTATPTNLRLDPQQLTTQNLLASGFHMIQVGGNSPRNQRTQFIPPNTYRVQQQPNGSLALQQMPSPSSFGRQQQQFTLNSNQQLIPLNNNNVVNLGSRDGNGGSTVNQNVPYLRMIVAPAPKIKVGDGMVPGGLVPELRDESGELPPALALMNWKPVANQEAFLLVFAGSSGEEPGRNYFYEVAPANGRTDVVCKQLQSGTRAVKIAIPRMENPTILIKNVGIVSRALMFDVPQAQNDHKLRLIFRAALSDGTEIKPYHLTSSVISCEETTPPPVPVVVQPPPLAPVPPAPEVVKIRPPSPPRPLLPPPPPAPEIKLVCPSSIPSTGNVDVAVLGVHFTARSQMFLRWSCKDSDIDIEEELPVNYSLSTTVHLVSRIPPTNGSVAMNATLFVRNEDADSEIYVLACFDVQDKSQPAPKSKLKEVLEKKKKRTPSPPIDLTFSMPPELPTKEPTPKKPPVKRSTGVQLAEVVETNAVFRINNLLPDITEDHVTSILKANDVFPVKVQPFDGDGTRVMMVVLRSTDKPRFNDIDPELWNKDSLSSRPNLPE